MDVEQASTIDELSELREAALKAAGDNEDKRATLQAAFRLPEASQKIVLKNFLEKCTPDPLYIRNATPPKPHPVMSESTIDKLVEAKIASLKHALATGAKSKNIGLDEFEQQLRAQFRAAIVGS